MQDPSSELELGPGKELNPAFSPRLVPLSEYTGEINYFKYKTRHAFKHFGVDVDEVWPSVRDVMFGCTGRTSQQVPVLLIHHWCIWNTNQSA